MGMGIGFGVSHVRNIQMADVIPDNVDSLTLAAGVYERTYDNYFGQLGAGPYDDQATYTTVIVNGGATITAEGATSSVSRPGTVAESTTYTETGYFLALNYVFLLDQTFVTKIYS